MIKITGFYKNGRPYEVFVKDENYADHIDNRHLSTDNGEELDLTSLIEEEITEEVEIYPLDAARLRIALSHFQLRATVENFIAGSGDITLQDAYAFVNEIHLDSPLVLGVKNQLGLSDSQVRELFIYGNNIQL